ncbi:MAG TPA: AMP-binding protein [Acidimicrobiales bacterium]|nr:AMP-binding protein [Acidimicrobiales bacterium]
MHVPLTIGDYLRRGALVYGDRVAVVDEPGTAGSLGTLTYRQLDARARGMALALDDLGVGPGERVAIVSPNAARFQIAFFGVSGYGRVLVPVNYRLNASEIGYIVEHSGASVLLVDPDSDAALAGVTAKHRLLLDGAEDAALFAEAPEGAGPAPWEADEQATASINYTSGTTARPKGVQLTHRNCWLNAAVFGWHTAVSDRDVFMHTLPMFHCNGWGMPYAVTAMGCPQVVVRRIEGEEILRRIDTHGVTLLCGAPAVVAAILDAAAARRERGEEVPGRSRVRIVVAGAPPPSRTIQRVEDELGWEFIQIYGLTETAPLLTINRAPQEWDGLDGAERAHCSRGPVSRRWEWPCAPTTPARSWRAPTTSSPATGANPTSRPRPSWTGGSTRATRATWTAPTSSSRTARRTSSSREGRTSAPSRSRTASTSTPASPRWP